MQEERDRLFPQIEERERTQSGVNTSDFISADFVKSAANRLKERKSPGLDGVPSEVIKILTDEKLRAVTEIFNQWYKNARFPPDWKEVKLVLINKPGRNLGDTSSYRPICLLDSFAKLYEGAILQKLNQEIERCGGLHEQQYGFKQGRSTIDAQKKLLGPQETQGKTAAGGSQWSPLI